jgi:hypothetical protein
MSLDRTFVYVPTVVGPGGWRSMFTAGLHVNRLSVSPTYLEELSESIEGCEGIEGLR